MLRMVLVSLTCALLLVSGPVHAGWGIPEIPRVDAPMLCASYTQQEAPATNADTEPDAEVSYSEPHEEYMLAQVEFKAVDPEHDQVLYVAVHVNMTACLA